MKAIVFERYGTPDVLQLMDVAKPVPKDNEVLIKTHVATVTMGDCELRAFSFTGWIWPLLRLMFGIFKPRNPILGQEISGEIEATGKSVTRFKKGDRIFGTTGFHMGGYAEYVCLPQTGAIVKMPTSMGYAEAAGIPTGGLNGLHFLRECKVQRCEKVLIYGAGGSIGTFAVQLAKISGAVVTAVDRSDKLEMLRSIGADQIIDYQAEDFTQSGEKYDVIIDVVGKSSFANSLAALSENGRYFLGNPRGWQMLRGAWISRRGGKKVLFKFAGESVDDLDYLKKLVSDGTINVVIDRAFPLEKMKEAHRYVEAHHKKGCVVINVRDEVD